ncbi:hypothetical protein ACJRO7_007652 [Eucalyptus globulus]|uniref:F-box domain-containing protein n=1 Tax=Eucalyptus globulus TaxID=34317 RepID=A0ABD3ILT8_EUCGL
MKRGEKKESDAISQLPRHITDQILSFLPIKDAIRTSILSRNWRYKWSTIPQLVFDDQCTSARGVPSLRPSLHENLVKIIDKVLLLHIGPIQNFKLSHKGFCATSDIDHWILHLSRVSIKKIILRIWKGKRYKIPISLFNCQDLIYLELSNCLVKIPLKFEGFKKLNILLLDHVELSQEGLEALISRCPLLETLGLNLREIKRVNIKSPNLRSLYLVGAFQDVTFDDMNRLKVVGVDVYDDIANRRGPSYANLSNLHKFFQNLHCLMHSNLFTDIDFNNVEEILTVMCLIRSSPQLKEVDFRARTGEQTPIGTTTNSWEDHQSSCFQQVRVASLYDISGGQPELRFIKFLLSRSPGLQKMRIRPTSSSGDGKFLRELLRFPRASAQAELIYLNPLIPLAGLLKKNSKCRY